MTFFKKTMLVMLVVMMVAPGSTMASMYQVGDATGWTVNHDYNEWIFFKQFKAGDILGKIFVIVLAPSIYFNSFACLDLFYQKLHIISFRKITLNLKVN